MHGAHDLTIVGGANGTITLDPDKASYSDGELVAVTAIPDWGYKFDGWTGDQTAMSFTTYIEMDGDKTLNASFTPYPTGQTQRLKPRNGLGTLLTDRGTRLRGAFIRNCYMAYQNEPVIMEGTKEGMLKARDEYGMNTMHLYLGDPESPLAHFQPLADSMVEWTREAGMYLVMTIGGCLFGPGDYDYDHVMAFWEHYAPLYADETHVIYEIQNEPTFKCIGESPQGVIDMNVDAYNIIRSYAPDKHVMVMSYATVLSTMEATLSDLQRLEAGGVDFDNASVSYHGYYWCSGAREHKLPEYQGQAESYFYPPLQDMGYPFVQTEPERENSLEGDIETDGYLIEFYENEMEVSWLSFYGIPWDDDDEQSLFNPETDFKGTLDALTGENAVSWCPDFGTWPRDASTCHGPVIGTNANLNSLSVDNGTLTPSFSANTTSYTVSLAEGTSTIPTVSATSQDSEATVDITQASSLTGSESDRTATIEVTAEDETTTKTYSVLFQLVPEYTLTTHDDGNGSISLDPSGGMYLKDTEVEATADPDDGYAFDKWKGDVSSFDESTNPLTITMNEDKFITANFIESTTELEKAFAFGATDYTRSVYNETSQNYIKVVQDGDNFTYSSSQGHGYTETDEIDGSANDRGSSACGEELYDQFIGVSGGDIIFRVDVSNGDYQFVAAMGDAAHSHTNTMKVRNGSSGTTLTLIDQVTCATDEYATVEFEDKVVPPCSGATFTSQPESPVLTVTNGYIEIIQSSSGFGGDLVLVEIWSAGTETTDPVTQFELSTTVEGDGSIELDPSATDNMYDSATTVTATANPADGYQFDGWSGASDATGSSVDIIMNSDKNLTADFSLKDTGDYTRLEAEDATYSSGDLKTDENASNGEYIDGNSGLNITWTYNSDSACDVDLEFAVSVPSNTRSLGVFVNDTKVGSITTSSSSWEEQVISASLNSGDNSIELRDSESTREPNVDYLDIVGGSGGTTPDPDPEPGTLTLYEAYAFGADSYTTETPNESSKNYVKVVQGGNNFTYSSTLGHGYTETDDIDNTFNNRGSSACGEELYDQFIGTSGGDIIFRVDVPNGDYQFVAAMGDAAHGHTNTLQVRDGSSGTSLTLVDNVACASDEYAIVEFGDKVVPSCSGATFTSQPESPVLTVTNEYIEIIQSAPNFGGDLVLIEIWSQDGNQKSGKAKMNVAEKSDENNSLIIFPNPLTSDELTIQTGEYNQAKLTISSVEGKLVYSKQLSGENELTIDSDILEEGIYVISFVSDGKAENKKLIVR